MGHARPTPSSSGAARTVDLRPFRLERFAENEPVPGAHEYSVLEGLGSRLV